MAESYYKFYLKHLALSINAFWQGYEEDSNDMLLKAELDFDSAIGKNASQKYYSNLPHYLKTWREIILNYNSSPMPSMPIPCHEMVKEVDPESEVPENISMSSEVQVEEKSPPRSLPELPTLEQDLNEVFLLYADDKIMDCIRLLEKLRGKHNCTFSEYPLIREIENDFQDIQEVFKACQDKEGWVNESSGKIKVSYKNIPGTRTYSILTEAEIEVPIFNFIALMYESDLYHTWVPFCKRSSTVANITRSRKIVAQEFHVPLIATRQTCLYGYGANLLLSDGIVVIVSKSCDHELTFKGIALPDIGKGKRAAVNMMGCIVRPLSYEKIHATIISNFDPMIKLVPYKVLNYFSRKLAKGMFKKIVKKAKNFEGSEYQKRINMPENREFYEYLERTQKEYLDSISPNPKV